MAPPAGATRIWTGPFYPVGTGPSAYLSEYARHFRAVEMNATLLHSKNIVSLNSVRSDGELGQASEQ